jgi:hypothetical protein
LAFGAITVLLVGTSEGCSSSTSSSHQPASTSAAPSDPSRMTAELVTRLVNGVVKRIRPVLAVERANCGGSQSIEQADSAIAQRCRQSLARLSALAHNLASLIMHVRPPHEMQGLVADTRDTADAVVTVFGSYPTSECLPTPVRDDRRRGECDTAGRELAALIAQWEQVLTRWPK